MLNFLALAEQAMAGFVIARRFLGLWGPVSDISGMLAPLAALSSVLALALLTGLAVGSLSTLVITVIVLYFVLTELFGISLEFELPA